MERSIFSSGVAFSLRSSSAVWPLTRTMVRIETAAEGFADDFDDVWGEGGFLAGFIRIARVGLQHPEDDEESHHEHDEIGEGEDPLGAFLALTGFFAMTGFLSHRFTPLS